MTQEDLAFRAGLSLTYVGELERGMRMASLDTVNRIATAFGMTCAELLAAAEL